MWVIGELTADTQTIELKCATFRSWSLPNWSLASVASAKVLVQVKEEPLDPCDLENAVMDAVAVDAAISAVGEFVIILVIIISYYQT